MTTTATCECGQWPLEEYGPRCPSCALETTTPTTTIGGIMTTETPETTKPEPRCTCPQWVSSTHAPRARVEVDPYCAIHGDREIDRPCRFCGAQVTSTKDDVDFCRTCFYVGNPQSERFAALSDEIAAIPGVMTASVWHTGGGCFAFGINFENGSYLMATDGEAGLPPSEDGPWSIGSYGNDDDAETDWGVEGVEHNGDFSIQSDRAGLVAAAKTWARVDALLARADAAAYEAVGEIDFLRDLDAVRALRREVDSGGTDEEIVERFVQWLLGRADRAVAASLGLARSDVPAAGIARRIREVASGGYEVFTGEHAAAQSQLASLAVELADALLEPTAESDDEDEPVVAVVPAEALANVLGIVRDIVLDGEGPENEVASAVAADVVRLNDALPPAFRFEGLRDYLAELLPPPWSADYPALDPALDRCRVCGSEAEVDRLGVCHSCDQQRRYDAASEEV